MRDRVDPGIGNPSGKYRDDRGHARIQLGGNSLDLLDRHDRGDIEDDTLSRQRLEDRSSKFALGIRHRYLDVDVLAPARDLAALIDHGAEIVGEDLERD